VGPKGGTQATRSRAERKKGDQSIRDRKPGIAKRETTKKDREQKGAWTIKGIKQPQGGRGWKPHWCQERVLRRARGGGAKKKEKTVESSAASERRKTEICVTKSKKEDRVFVVWSRGGRYKTKE